MWGTQLQRNQEALFRHSERKWLVPMRVSRRHLRCKVHTDTTWGNVSENHPEDIRECFYIRWLLSRAREEHECERTQESQGVFHTLAYNGRRMWMWKLCLLTSLSGCWCCYNHVVCSGDSQTSPRGPIFPVRWLAIVWPGPVARGEEEDKLWTTVYNH